MQQGLELWRKFRRNRAALFGVFILAVVILMAASADLAYPGDPMAMVAKPYVWPFEDPEYFLGTDHLGRDVAAIIMHGSRVSLAVGILATILASLIGIVVGACAGYYGGHIDDALMRFSEIFQVMPNFLFALVMGTVLGPSLGTIVLAIGLVTWPSTARLVRAEFLTLREREFVLAARGIGMSDIRILFGQILPNALPPVIVLGAIHVAFAILVESALAFLGLSDPNQPSWGWLIGNGRQVLRTAWYICAIPGIAILMTVMAINVVSEGLNDALNPRLHRS